MHKGKKFLRLKAVEVESPSQTESDDPIHVLSYENSRWVATWWVYVRCDLMRIREPGRPVLLSLSQLATAGLIYSMKLVYMSFS